MEPNVAALRLRAPIYSAGDRGFSRRMPRIAAGTVERLAAFIQSLGAKATVMDADEHDRLMAFLSHLPQLTVSALMEVVGDATASSGLRLAGRGLVDSTRLASSPADVWRDVCASNAGDIGAALDLLIARLQHLRAGLADAETVDRVFERAAHWRSVDEGPGIANDFPHHFSHRVGGRPRGGHLRSRLACGGGIHPLLDGRASTVWVANQRFRGRTDLVLLHIDPARMRSEIRYENLEGGETLFPHVYGPNPDWGSAQCRAAASPCMTARLGVRPLPERFSIHCGPPRPGIAQVEAWRYGDGKRSDHRPTVD